MIQRSPGQPSHPYLKSTHLSWSDSLYCNLVRPPGAGDLTASQDQTLSDPFEGSAVAPTRCFEWSTFCKREGVGVVKGRRWGAPTRCFEWSTFCTMGTREGVGLGAVRVWVISLQCDGWRSLSFCLGHDEPQNMFRACARLPERRSLTHLGIGTGVARGRTGQGLLVLEGGPCQGPAPLEHQAS